MLICCAVLVVNAVLATQQLPRCTACVVTRQSMQYPSHVPAVVIGGFAPNNQKLDECRYLRMLGLGYRYLAWMVREARKALRRRVLCDMLGMTRQHNEPITPTELVRRGAVQAFVRTTYTLVLLLRFPSSSDDDDQNVNQNTTTTILLQYYYCILVQAVCTISNTSTSTSTSYYLQYTTWFYDCLRLQLPLLPVEIPSSIELRRMSICRRIEKSLVYVGLLLLLLSLLLFLLYCCCIALLDEIVIDILRALTM